MFAKVAFVQKDDTLSRPYDYLIDGSVHLMLFTHAFVIVESSRGAYGIGVFLQFVDTVDDPAIVTKKVVALAPVPSYDEYLKGCVTHG